MDDTDIAIIGMACRFPGAETIEQFWYNLIQGVEPLHHFSDYHPQWTVSTQTDAIPFIKVNNLIKNFDAFDADFFGISEYEARIMDPQHRIFLECAWSALEHAGYHPETLPNLTGLYAGVYANYYLLRNIYANGLAEDPASELMITLGNEKDHLTTYAAYKLNLKGPVMTMQSTCSSSLASVYLACESLLTYAADVMLAGGVTISVPQTGGYYYQKGGLLSEDGHIRSFDAKATGTVYSNGAGVVVLKRLADATKDRDTIFAVIKGAALNNDGASKIGYVAPSVDGQVDVIMRALRNADIDPASISYLEGHGTGTPLGDSIEIEALHKAYTAIKPQSCALGSVKSNIGHLGPASGVSGLIKIALSLYHKKLPPSLNFDQPNQQLDSPTSPFYVLTKEKDWTCNGKRRTAISSFGLGGTNVHMILEEAPKTNSLSHQKQSNYLFCLSAKTPDSLAHMVAAIYKHLSLYPQIDPLALAYTLQVGRQAFPVRLATVFKSIEDLSKQLADYQPTSFYSSAEFSSLEIEAGISLEKLIKLIKNTPSLLKHFEQEIDKQTSQSLNYLISKIWQLGVAVNWSSFYKNIPSYRIPLPTYAFQRKRYWIDEKQHLYPQQNTIENEHDDITQEMIALWQKCLGTDEIDMESNFFEKGGTSLSATSLVTGIQKHFGVEMELKNLFEDPTVKGATDFILNQLILHSDQLDLESLIGKYHG